MRPLAAALVVFLVLAATAVAQAHVPDNCVAIIDEATKVTKELAASRADKND